MFRLRLQITFLFAWNPTLQISIYLMRTFYDATHISFSFIAVMRKVLHLNTRNFQFLCSREGEFGQVKYLDFREDERFALKSSNQMKINSKRKTLWSAPHKRRPVYS